MMMTQIDIFAVVSGSDANNWLREWQKLYPKRKIKNVSVAPFNEIFMLTIVYDVEV